MYAADPQRMREAMSWLFSPYALIVSFLPEDTRRRLGLDHLPLAAATFVSAFIEVLSALLIMVFGFRAYRFEHYQAVTNPQDGYAPAMVFGATLWVGFLLFSPAGLFSIYLVIEGVIRIAAAATGSACGSLGPFLIERFFLAQLSAAKQRALPRLVPDEVRPSDARGGLEIWTCRNRGWDDLTTLEIDGAYYHIVEHREHDSGVRPHVYAIAPIPSSWIMRGIVAYAPENVIAEHDPKRRRAQGR